MKIADQLAEIRKRTEDELQHFPDLKRAEGDYPIFDCCTLLAIIDADRAVLREIAKIHGPCACKRIQGGCIRCAVHKRLAE